MKKLIVFTLILCLLTGCVYIPAERPDMEDPKTEENTEETVEEVKAEPFLTLDDYPKMDGSTANLPLMAAVLSAATGTDAAEAENLVGCTTTPYAWECLARDQADILLVYEAAEDTKALLEEIGTEMEITPIGLDALVFIVNEQNPVQSMTQDELRAVYTGSITNWKELGGEDLAITAFQRVPTSGSQSLFMKLLMKDTAPMEAPKEFAPSAMGELIEGLAAYNNEGSALGYSVFYYASYMYAKPGLRFLAVDGVAPSDETIADQTYPLLNPFYVAIRADEPEGSPARRLRDWLLTEEGMQVIADAGYIPYQ